MVHVTSPDIVLNSKSSEYWRRSSTFELITAKQRKSTRAPDCGCFPYTAVCNLCCCFLWHLLRITEIKSEVNPSRRSNKTNLIKIHPEYCRLFPRTCLLFIFTIFASISPMDCFMAVPFWAWLCERSLPVKRLFFVLTVTNAAHRGSSDVGFYSFFLSRCQNFIFHVWSTSSAFDVTLISQKPHEQAICVGLPESTTFPTASLFFCWKPPDLWRLWEHYLMTKTLYMLAVLQMWWVFAHL